MEQIARQRARHEDHADVGRLDLNPLRDAQRFLGRKVRTEHDDCYLRRAVVGTGFSGFFLSDPNLASLRSDPEFEAIAIEAKKHDAGQ